MPSRPGAVQVAVDARELRAIANVLEDIGDRELQIAYRRALRKAAEPIAQEVRTRYAAYSTRIPRAVRIKVKAGGRVVLIEVGGTPSTPHARTVEGRINGTPGRHPVFARGPRSEWTWVAQVPPRQIVAKVVAARTDRFVFDVIWELMRVLDRRVMRPLAA
jgi:hypothetical protein